MFTKKSKEWKAYETKAVYNFEDLPLWFLEWHSENSFPFWLEDECVNPSQNLALFVRDALECPDCKMKASFWALQRSGNRPYHLNLWGVDNTGAPRLFTKDHVKPRSKGGADCLSNYRVMCMKCNGKKGDKTD